MTPLHHAIAHPRCVSLLLDQGCEVDTLDKTGRTPLFFALKHGFTESSRILLAKGTSVNVSVVACDECESCVIGQGMRGRYARQIRLVFFEARI
jgi:ankyrin repeat protein